MSKKKKENSIVLNFLDDKDKLKNNLSSYSRKRTEKSSDSEQYRKAKNESYLFYPISEEDSEIIILLKNTINESKLTMQDIYNKLGSSKGYNLHYGLMKRNEIKLSSLQAWADIMNKKIFVQFTDNDEE